MKQLLINIYNIVHMARASKRIPVHEETFEELGEIKGAGETWDDVIQELLETRWRENRRELLERTDDDDYVEINRVLWEQVS